MFAIAAVAGLSSASLSGSVYRVDAINGNDNNDGISAAWRTLAKVNARSFQPGDQVLLHAGQTWHETLVISSSGASGNPIVFSSYGSGTKPVLQEDGVRWPAVRVNGKAYVTIKYLQLQNASNISLWVTDGSNIRIEGLVIKNSYSHGISVDGISPGVIIYNNVFALDVGFKMRGSFVRFFSPVEGVTISYNNATLNGNLGTSNGIFAFNVNNALIHHNTIRGGTTGIGVNATTRNVRGTQIYANAVYNTDATYGDGESIEFTGLKVEPHYSVSGSIYQNFVKGGTNTQGGINGVWAPNARVYRNIVIGFIKNTAFHWSSNCPNGVFYNNTIYSAHYGFLVESGSTAIIENNIMANMTSRGIAVGAAGSATEDYNLYYKDGRGNYGISLGPHSFNADPRFISATPINAGDVRLQADSPAIGAGASLGSPYDFALDPAGSTFPFPVVDQDSLSSAWTIGAFAYRP